MPVRKKVHLDPPTAEDAIPHDAITFTEAFDIVQDAIEEQPSKISEIDEDWLDALHRSREFEMTVGHDLEAFDAELEEHWHLQKVASVFLRAALENEELRACIQDPRSGKTLQLPAKGWVTKEWMNRGYVPSVRSDYATPNDSEYPGPAATVVAGKACRVFFIPCEFDAWLTDTFGPDPDSSSEAIVRRNPGWRLIDAVVEAYLAIWGGVPAGIPASKQEPMINKWLQDKGRLIASSKTIFRARARLLSTKID
jgi:hypothetical protein